MVKKIEKVTRIKELDSLRGIAAVFVVLYHYTSRYLEIYNLPYNTAFYNFTFGHLGVELFFMISGFVILMSLENINNGWEFLKKRFLRLYPIFWVGVILTFFLVTLIGLPNREVGFRDFLVNLTMFHEFFKIPHVDGVYRSLTVELTFYLLVAITLFKNKLFFIKWGWILLVVLMSIVLFKSITFLNSSYVFKYFHLFYAGSLFYAWRTKLMPVYIVLGLIFMTLFQEYLLHGFTFFKPIVFFYLLFFALQANVLKYLSNKVFIFFGFISYPLYIIHQNLGYLIIYHMGKNGLDYHFGIIVAFIFSVILAWLLAKKVEPYIQKKLKYYLFKK